LRALSDAAQGGFFLRKKPLSGCGFGVHRLWNRYTLPPMNAEVVAHYEQMAERIPRQAASLTTL
jgi:hypothetical protein